MRPRAGQRWTNGRRTLQIDAVGAGASGRRDWVYYRILDTGALLRVPLDEWEEAVRRAGAWEEDCGQCD